MAKATSGNPDTLITLFQSIGLSPSKSAEAAKNQKGASVLKDLIERRSLATGNASPIQEKQAGLIAALATQIAKSAKLDASAQDYVLDKILSGDLKSVDQVNGEFRLLWGSWCRLMFLDGLEAATKYVETHSLPVDESDFNEQCGVG